MLTEKELRCYHVVLKFLLKMKLFPVSYKNGLLRREHSKYIKLFHKILFFYHFSAMMYLLYWMNDTVQQRALFIGIFHCVILIFHCGVILTKYNYHIYSVETLQLVNRILLLNSLQGK